MSVELLVGPPGSGKTRALLGRAKDSLASGQRVWWVGLPNQRSHFYRRAAADGALLGLEFLTMQQLCYRLLAHAQALAPLVVGTGRLALVGEALAQVSGVPPMPGEARLFAAAIAECKRHGLAPELIEGDDREVARLRTVYLLYERLKGDSWDYDDFRREALELALAGRATVEAAALFVDGFRELGPLDLRLLRRLAETVEVSLALPKEPPGWKARRRLQARTSPRVDVHVAPNPVAEARWVLRALKKDLACGLDPLDVAVILPPGEAAAFAALADEYGVPVMDESRVSLADSPPGKLLLELLELPDHPTPSGLLALPGLEKLGLQALENGVSGREAIALLARRLELEADWLAALETLSEVEDTDSWAARLVEKALSLLDEAGGAPSPLDRSAFKSEALQRAKEASRVAAGEAFRGWWAALLRETSITVARPGGVALLDERLASGRRYRRLYLLGANQGVYGRAQGEDYFVPEEDRISPAQLKDGRPALPRRFLGQADMVFDELLGCAEELCVSYSQADQSGPLLPEPALLAGKEPQPLPSLPAGNLLESTAVGGGRPDGRELPPRRQTADTGPALSPRGSESDLSSPDPVRDPRHPTFGLSSLDLTVEELRDYDECSMRFWLRRLPGVHVASGEEAWWEKLVARLRDGELLKPEGLPTLTGDFPQAAEWLEANADELSTLSFGFTLPTSGPGPRVRLDAVKSKGGDAFVYTFVAPGAADDDKMAREYLRDRWSEPWAAGHLLQRYRRADRVVVMLWPLLGEPVEAVRGGIRRRWKRLDEVAEKVSRAAERLSREEVRASPGRICRECPVRDVCREGAP